MDIEQKRIISDYYRKLLETYPSVKELFNDEQIAFINDNINEKELVSEITPRNVISVHKLLVRENVAKLSKIFKLSYKDAVGYIVSNSLFGYELIENPVPIDGKSEHNLQSLFLIRQEESNIDYDNTNIGLYLYRTDRIKVCDGIYREESRVIKTKYSDYAEIYKAIASNYVAISQKSQYNSNIVDHLQNQAVYALWEYAVTFGDKNYSSSEWIKYRLKNNQLYGTYSKDSYNGNVSTSLTSNEKSNNNWQKGKYLIFNNSKK